MALRTLYVKDFFSLLLLHLHTWRERGREVTYGDKQHRCEIYVSLANLASLFFCVGVFSLTAIFNIVLFSGAEERGPGVWNLTAINYIYYIEFNCFFFLISLLYKNNTFQAVHSLDKTRKTSSWVCDPVLGGVLPVVIFRVGVQALPCWLPQEDDCRGWGGSKEPESFTRCIQNVVFSSGRGGER